MMNKMSKPVNTVKNSAIFICPSRKLETKNKVDKVKQGNFTQKFMTDAINKAVRNDRYLDKLQPKNFNDSPLVMRNQSYSNIFNKLLESCQCFFTSEYGKNEEDFKRFMEGKTKIYETSPDNDIITLERMRSFSRSQHEKTIVKESISSGVKKSKYALSNRVRSKSRVVGDQSKLRLRQVRRRSKSYKKLKLNMSKIMVEEGEKSPSILTLSDSEEPILNKSFLKKVKPFVFKLSDPKMKERGITVNYEVPIRVINFATNPANSLTFWFRKRPVAFETYYPDGSICLQFGTEGSGTVYYKNGDPAITFVFGRIGPLIIVYTQSHHLRGKIIRQVPVAIFDLKGNGVVYDNHGKKRLVYDQAQGVLFDTPTKLPLKWQWESYWQVMCRRAELEFVPQNSLKDFDYDKKKLEREKKFHSKQSTRKTKQKRISSIFLKDIDKNKRNKLSQNRKSSINFLKRSLATKRLNYNPSLIAKQTKSQPLNAKLIKVPLRLNQQSAPLTLDAAGVPSKTARKGSMTHVVPKLLKFVGNGFIIKPIPTPCSELFPGNHRISIQSTLLSMDSKDQKSEKKKHVMRTRSRRKIVPPEELELIPPSRCMNVEKQKSLLKPIVMRLTDKVSLTIKEQSHIHIDFSSHPMHYMFSLGVFINIKEHETIFDIKDPEARYETLPSIFELLKNKCQRLYNINNSIKSLRIKSESKYNRDKMRKLKNWGHEKLLGKVPLCKLMDNKCVCMDCYCERGLL